MNTGEIVIYAEKGDIHFFMSEHLGIKPNPLSPFAASTEGYSTPVAQDGRFAAIAGNPDAVACLKILAQPVITFRVRLGGPAVMPEEVFACTADYRSFVLVSTIDQHSYGIQYCNTKEHLAGFLLSILMMNQDNEYEPRFPASMDYEFFILLANTIDAYKYVLSRNALNHETPATLVLSVAEFNTLLQNSLAKPDLGWLVTTIGAFLPSAIIQKLNGNEKNYTDLFESGYLLAVKNNQTGEDSLMLNILAIDAGAEFMNTWIKAAGVEILTLNDKGVEVRPLAFLCSTVLTTHCFEFSMADSLIHYKPLSSATSLTVIEKFFDVMPVIQPGEIPKPAAATAFCVQCGAKLNPGARFCTVCGNKLT